MYDSKEYYARPYVKKRQLVKSLKWQKDYPERVNRISNKWYHKKKDELFSLILNHYGKECSCCGEQQIEFLTVDHINGDGAEHRRRLVGHKTLAVYKDIIKNNFPDGFRVLCYNCNMGRKLGSCPHKQTP